VENRSRLVATIIILGILLLLLTKLPLKMNMASYTIIAIIAVAIILISTTRDDQLSHAGTVKGGENTPVSLGMKEKKLIIFHILTLLDRKECVDMNELAADLNVSIYTLSEIVKFLGKHKAATVIYPPMHNFPILRRGDRAKSMGLRQGIFREIAKKNILADAKIDDFAREVEEYLQSMRREQANRQ